jgi:hypothetical protein
VSRSPDDGRDVSFKGRVVNRVHPNRSSRLWRSAQRQFNHQFGVICLATGRSTIFAVKGDVENASAKALGHLGLQLQAFAHPQLYAAVMITNRQQALLGLCRKQHVAWVLHEG